MYSELLWEHFHSPFNNHRCERAHRSARKVNPICPDVVELFLTLQDDRVSELSFTAEACPPTVAAASLLCQWAGGRSLQELAQLTEAELAGWLGPLPPNKRHAVQLTFLALQGLLES